MQLFTKSLSCLFSPPPPSTHTFISSSANSQPPHVRLIDGVHCMPSLPLYPIWSVGQPSRKEKQFTPLVVSFNKLWGLTLTVLYKFLFLFSLFFFFYYSSSLLTLDIRFNLQRFNLGWGVAEVPILGGPGLLKCLYTRELYEHYLGTLS